MTIDARTGLVGPGPVDQPGGAQVTDAPMLPEDASGTATAPVDPIASCVAVSGGSDAMVVHAAAADGRRVLTEERPGTFTVPIGPQHPALKEPGHFSFTVEGETVTAASVRLGYVHRGIEKAAEARSWVQDLYLLERVCGICSHCHATAFSLAVEKLAKVEVPPRAMAIRELVAELERIHSHLLWLGVAAHEAGFETLFMFTWRDRETVMDLLEGLTGNRVNYSANLLGGVKIDVDQDQADAMRRGVDYLRERIVHYRQVATTDETFLGRTRDIGVMTAEQAERLGVVGPTARASGVARDIRIDAPYVSYSEFPVSLCLDGAGDLAARVAVRVAELEESCRVIEALLDGMPSGELVGRMPRRVPAGEAIARVEAPRGELLYFVKSAGGDKPDRVKVRTPTMCNMGSVVALAVGHKLADVPMLLAGIDPCFSCNDRLVSVDGLRGGRDVWTWERLRRYGIEYYRARGRRGRRMRS